MPDSEKTTEPAALARALAGAAGSIGKLLLLRRNLRLPLPMLAHLRSLFLTVGGFRAFHRHLKPRTGGRGPLQTSWSDNGIAHQALPDGIVGETAVQGFLQAAGNLVVQFWLSD